MWTARPLKKIQEFPKYWVDEDGRVYSRQYGMFRELKSRTRKNGYKQVVLRKNKKSYTRLVHRLVAESTIPNPRNYPCINHINGVKDHNNISNLEWCTHKQNTQSAIKNNNMKCVGSFNVNAKLTETQIKTIRNEGRKYTYTSLADYYDVSVSVISNIVNNKAWTHVTQEQAITRREE